MASFSRYRTPAEFAEEVGRSVETVRTWIAEGKLRAIQRGKGKRRRHWLIPEQAIAEFERGEVAQPQPQPPSPRQRRERSTDWVDYY